MVKIKLGGKERELVFTLNALDEYEELTGRNALMENIFKNISAKETKALLFSALKQDDPEITIQDVGKMVSVSNFEEVLTALAKAYNGDTPDSKGGEETDNEKKT